MKTRYIHHKGGMTLIEIIIYTMLLSILLTTSISYLYSIDRLNIKLTDEIYDAYKK
jgi:type II secretory pathway pseudopilin PulG